MPANPTVPLRANSLQLHVCETCLCEPVNVFLFCWEQHPHVCKKSREPECRMHGTNETRFSSLLEHSVSFSDTALRVRPVLNAVTQARTMISTLAPVLKITCTKYDYV